MDHVGEEEAEGDQVDHLVLPKTKVPYKNTRVKRPLLVMTDVAI